MVLPDPPGAATPASSPGSSPDSSRALWTIAFTVFLDLLGFGMVIPILQLYAKSMGATTEQTGYLLAIYSVMQLVFAPIWGRLSDRVGRRPVLLLSIFGSCASQLGYALSPTLGLLMFSRAIAGVCGANISAAQAYVTDVTEPRARAGALGVLGSALGLGFIFGPFLGGELGKIDPRLPFFVASALSAVNLGLAYLLIKEPARRRKSAVLSLQSLYTAVSSSRLLGYLLLFLLVSFGFATMEGVFALFCQSRFGYGERDVGRLFALVGVVMILVQGGLVRRLVPRMGERRLAQLGIFLMGVGLVAMAQAQGLSLLLLGLVLLAAGSGMNNPSLSSLIAGAAGDGRGAVLGVSQSLSALGRILGPIVGTRLLSRTFAGAPLLLAAGCMGAGLLFSLTWARYQK